MNYHNILHDDMLNGEGLRTVLFVSGCNHQCIGCHNSETWNKDSGILFDDEAKNEILATLKNDYIAGITLSGGDPLFEDNREVILDLLKEIKKKYPNKTIWVYTGFDFDTVKNLEHMNYIDILVDGKFNINKISLQLHWIGSSNQRIIDVQKSLKENKIVLYI